MGGEERGLSEGYIERAMRDGEATFGKGRGEI